MKGAAQFEFRLVTDMESPGKISGYYKTLDVSRTASLEEIAESYRVLVKVWHPDRFAHDPGLQARAQEKLKELNEAYERIKQVHNTPAALVNTAGSTPGVYPYPYAGGGEAAGHGLFSPRLFVAAVIVLGLVFSSYLFVRLMGFGEGVSGRGKMVIETVSPAGAPAAVSRPVALVVEDKKRGLLWMRNGKHWGKPVGFKEAAGFINELKVSGYAGCRSWRLPTSGELLALAAEPDDFKALFRNLRGTYLSSTPAMLDDYTLAVNVSDGRKEEAWKRGASRFFLLPVCELSD